MTPAGETDLKALLKTLSPKLNVGEFVFCVVPDLSRVALSDVIMFFREEEGTTIIIRKERADRLKLAYSFVASWITLTVHSSLAAVGMTAAFAKALTEKGIICNVVAAFYHDHIFVDKKDAEMAIKVLSRLSE